MPLGLVFLLEREARGCSAARAALFALDVGLRTLMGEAVDSSDWECAFEDNAGLALNATGRTAAESRRWVKWAKEHQR